MPDDRRLRARIQLIPNLRGLNESASTPSTPQEQQALAQMALLSGVPANNTQIRQFIGTLNNRIYSTYIRGASS